MNSKKFLKINNLNVEFSKEKTLINFIQSLILKSNDIFCSMRTKNDLYKKIQKFTKWKIIKGNTKENGKFTKKH